MSMKAIIIYALLLLTFVDVTSSLTLTSGQRIAPRKSPTKSVAENLPTEDVEITSLSSQNCIPQSFFDLPSVEKWGEENGLKQHHLKTIYRVVMKSSSTFMSNEKDSTANNIFLEDKLRALDFPKKHIPSLLSKFTYTCTIHHIEKSQGGAKFVIQLQNGKLVESVLIEHTRPNGVKRYTVCVSSQIGCAKKCSFCATGTMGLVGQLSSGEILEQIHLLNQYVQKEYSTHGKEGSIRNVVFMGQGEPLDNFDAVHESLRGITHQCLFGLKAKQVTLSTVGASAQKIRALADEAPQVCLALSLHSAIQSSREKLIPSAISSPIDDIGDALDYHALKSGRGSMLEYLLIDGVNDSDEEVDALAEFCLKRKGSIYVNLIPYNPTLAGDDFGYRTPSDERISVFHEKLKETGVKALVRWSTTNGRDANGACGQLALSSSL